MYICVCKAVTDTAIRESVGRGAGRMRDLKASLGVAGQCGICACHVKAVLEQTLMQVASVQHLATEQGGSQKFPLEEVK